MNDGSQPPPYNTTAPAPVVATAPGPMHGMYHTAPATTTVTTVTTPAAGPGAGPGSASAAAAAAGPKPLVLYEHTPHAAGAPWFEMQFGRPRPGRVFRWCCCECNLSGCCKVIYYMFGCCLWERMVCYRHCCVCNVCRCSCQSCCWGCCCTDDCENWRVIVR
eukprot:m.60874 g.60874  ORF g.60874 m.60874 type:complete len:162 (+) comp13692_c1_seq1:596-1081(+)